MAHAIPSEIHDLVARGATFVLNDSGGKDSQAQKAFVRSFVPASQIIVVHAVLPDVEWDGVEEHVRATSEGLEVFTCRSRRTLLQMIEERGMFPSPTLRQCTSDLKRGPIERTIRQYCARTGQRLIVNCMGLRAEESSARAKATVFKLNEKNSKAGREWYDWLPIHAWKVGEVFAAIEAAGQRPHWAYMAGMTRLSCCFCIMASTHDLTTAARLNPQLYRRYVELERSTGQVMLMPQSRKGLAPVRRTLEQVTGVYIDEPQGDVEEEPEPELVGA